MSALAGRHLYLDANTLIEGVELPGSTLAALLAALQAGETLASTSELTLGEVLVRPLARKARALVASYEELLGDGVITTVPVSRAILRAAAALAGRSRMALPDCIHVATAIAAGCDVFVSSDRAIVLPAEMELRRLADGWPGADLQVHSRKKETRCWNAPKPREGAPV